MAKSIQNTDAVACKLRPALIKATNYKLEVTRKEQCNRKEMVEKQKAEAMAAKRYRDRRRISLSSEEEGNYKDDTGDNMDPN